MKVSVVMAVYNRAGLVGECLESILAQTFQDFEVIVVDDCSEDNTLDILQSFAERDKRIRVFSNPRHRFIETLNIGMSMAKGEYIARIDSDDVMLPERLEKQVELFERDASVTVCCSWFNLFGTNQSKQEGMSGRVIRPYHRFLLGNFLANPTSMIRRSFLEKNQLHYHEDYIFSEDYKLWTEIARLGGGFFVIPEYLVKYRVHEGQLSFRHRTIQAKSAFKARTDVLNNLVEKHCLTDGRFETLFTMLAAFNDDGLLSPETIFHICYEMVENKSRLSQEEA